MMLHKEKGAFWLPFLRGVGLIAATAAAAAAVRAGIAAAAGAVGGDVGGIAAGEPQPHQNENDDPPPVIAAAAAAAASTRIAAHSVPSYYSKKVSCSRSRSHRSHCVRRRMYYSHSRRHSHSVRRCSAAR